MSERLKSRKLWVTVATIIAFAINAAVGDDVVSTEAAIAVAMIAGTYVLGQSWVDKTVVTEEIKVGGDMARIEVIAYAKNLEQRLAALLEEEEVQE